jgi:hypothetical protein
MEPGTKNIEGSRNLENSRSPQLRNLLFHLDKQLLTHNRREWINAHSKRLNTSPCRGQPGFAQALEQQPRGPQTNLPKTYTSSKYHLGLFLSYTETTPASTLSIC